MMIILWPFYRGFIRVITIIFIWVPKIRQRLIFETKNIADYQCRSFRLSREKADLCFEFSSEGEFQQVASLIQDALTAGKKLELVFFSPSVEKTVMDLASKFPDQIRYLRFPLLRLEFLSWITASELILVRYDLFPEFLFWASRKNHILKMVWVSFKKTRIKNKGLSFYKEHFLKTSKFVVYATDADQKFAQKIKAGPVYDFRMDSIQRRITNRLEKFNQIFAAYGDLKKQITPKSLIVGNAWPSDMFLLEKIPADTFMLIVPHQLDPAIITSMEESLKKMGRSPVVSTGESIPETKTLILSKKGVLCELYADFTRAYVGGGFETSIHSVLEPLIAGSEAIACGPIHQRSTEYDLAQDASRIAEVNSTDEFAQWFDEGVKNPKARDQRPVFGKYNDYRKEIISC
jgi:3-deoxy-D-manno-octulosonic-acid transferase